MKVLVTGASGFIGTSVIKALNEQEISYLVIGRNCPKFVDEADFLSIDLSTQTVGSLSEVLDSKGCTHLLHLAWYVDPVQFWDGQENLDWIAFSITLFRAFHIAGGKTIVCAGSCAEYSESQDILSERSSHVNPKQLYGMAKLSLKNATEVWAHKHNINFRWARVFFAYGADMPDVKLIPSLLNVLEGKQPVFTVNAHDRRDFIYIDDVAQAMLCLLSTTRNGTFNVCSEKSHSVFEILDILRELTGRDVELIKTMANETAQNKPIIGSNIRLKEIGWQPKYDLVSGLSEILTARPIAAAGI